MSLRDHLIAAVLAALVMTLSLTIDRTPGSVPTPDDRAIASDRAAP